MKKSPVTRALFLLITPKNTEYGDRQRPRFSIYAGQVIITGTGHHQEQHGTQGGDPGGDFQVLILSDTHVRGPDMPNALRLARFVDTMRSIPFPRAELAMVTGDIIDSLHADCGLDPADPRAHHLATAMFILNQSPIPFYPVMGNHEYKPGPDCKARTHDEMMKVVDVWKEHTGRDTYYAFIHRGWKFIALDNTRGRYLSRRFGEEQLDWLEGQLAENIPAVLFMHRPMETSHDIYWSGGGRV